MQIKIVVRQGVRTKCILSNRMDGKKGWKNGWRDGFTDGWMDIQMGG